MWAIPHRKSPTGHGTEKPVECMRRPIENNSSPGQAVYEPFSGSGTTIIAAEMHPQAENVSKQRLETAMTVLLDQEHQNSRSGPPSKRRHFLV